MIKYVLILTLALSGSAVNAGECVTGKCNLRSRSVVVVREIISVPVTVTRKTVETARTFGRKTVSRVRNIVR